MKIHYNAPVTLTFTLICGVLLGVDYLSADSMKSLFALHGSLSLPFHRLFTYVAIHENMDHLLGNMIFILLLGPLLEEKFGSKLLLGMMVFTTLVTSLLNVLLFSTGIIGASGLVFMFIILSSFNNIKSGYIPLTFILVAVFFIGKEVINSINADNISQFGHIAGGICGGIIGLFSKNVRKKLSV